MKKAKRLYGKLSAKYDQKVLKTAYKHHFIVPQWIAAALGKKKAKVLDLGCGTGLSSAKLFEKGYEITGIDFTKSMLAEAERKGIFSALICQDLEKRLKFPSTTFDAVLLVGVLEWIKNPKKLFKQVSRVLKPQGLFGLTVMNTASEKEMQSYSQEEIETIFQSTGFYVRKHKIIEGYKKKDEIIVFHAYLLERVN